MAPCTGQGATPSLGSLAPASSPTAPREEPEALATLEEWCMVGCSCYAPPVQGTAEQEAPQAGSPPPALHSATFSDSDGEEVNINTCTST